VSRISLRPPERDGDVGIRVQVRPRHSTAPPQHTFDEKLDSLDGLAELIERASDFMDLGPRSHAVHGNGVSAPVGRFSRDILSIEVRQEGYQPLTLVDLPGIIQSGKKQQNESESDKKMVNSIVNEWVKDPRTIILAVMDATRDIESHSILEKAMKAKHWEYRTLGIITKPDIPQKFEASQRSWVKIALNEHEDYSFRQGWHVLMNRDERSLRVASTSSDRDEMEKSFLSNPENGWSEVVDRSAMQIRNNVKPRTCGWGVEQLKARLYELLEDQTYRYLPEIRNSVQIKIQQLEAQLDKLGFKESTPQQAQKRFLLLCAEMADITKHGMEGNYDRRFKLSNWHLEKGRLSLGHVSKLRNNIRDHDLKFAKLIRSNGHDTFFAPACDSTSVEQSDWIGKVATILEKTKGEELQTHVDPKRIGLFFWDYSKGWERIALDHIQAISDECEKFLRWVVQSTLNDIFPSLADTLFSMHIRPKLKRRFNEARQELAKLEFDRERAPRTENPDFEIHSLRAKNRNVWRIVMQALDERNKDALDPDLWESPEYLAKATKLASMSDRQDQEAAQFMTDMLIYYRVSPVAWPFLPLFGLRMSTETDLDRPQSLHR
jgi:hypothetical protein